MQSRITKLQSLIEKAAERARSEKRDVLVSLMDRVDEIDPLDALDVMSARISSGGVTWPAPAAERMYWERPSEGFVLAALGAARTFEYSGRERFESASRDWELLVKDAIIDEGDPAPVTGPMLMGGFSFDADGPHTRMWDGFSSAHLIVPRILVSLAKGEARVTMNVVVSPDGKPDFDVKALSELVDSVGSRSLRPDFDGDFISAEPGSSDLSTRGEWQEMVRTAIAEIRGGRLDKVVLARGIRVTAPDAIDVVPLLRSLRSVHTESFIFGIWESDRAFVGASPERLVRLTGRDVEASSLAGTIERGATPAADSANAETLRRSMKDLAEHAAVRDELFSALTQTCDDVRAAENPSLLTLPNMHHLHTSLRARLRDGGSLLELVGRLHPTPAVGGSPRDAALRFIEAHENLDRGWYAAPVGWIGRSGGEFAVALRSALIRGNEATLFAGCGIVRDSDPDLEYAESSLKLQAMQSAIAVSISGEPADLAMTSVSERSA
jgi:isochorismate synthase